MKFQSADEYITSLPQEQQDGLRQIRQSILEVLPDAEKTISYRLPAFEYYGMLVYFSAYKDHYSISFPPPFQVFDVFKEELENFEVSKTAVKFPFDKPFPLQLVINMVKFKERENETKALKK